MKKTLLFVFGAIFFISESAIAQCGQNVLDNLTGGSSSHTSTITSGWSKHEFDITFPNAFWGQTINDVIVWYRLDAGYGSGVNVTNGGFTTGDNGGPVITFVNSSSQTATPPNTTQTDLYHVWDFTGQPLTIPGNGVLWFRFNYVSGGGRRRMDVGSNTYTSTYQQNDITRSGFTSFAIYAGIGFSVTQNVINVLCNGDSTGNATVTPSGNNPPFTYQWDANTGNQTDSTATGLTAGAYLVTITDNLNCSQVDTVTVIEPTALISTASSTDALCVGSGDGSATATPSGGTSGYTYLWDANAGNQTDSTATGLTAGAYLVTITDNNNCSITDTVTVTDPPALTSATTSVDESCFGNGDGSATVTPSGGTGVYTYLWDANTGNQTDSTATGLSGGTYLVTITDSNGCTDTASVTVNTSAGLSSSTSVNDDVDNNCVGDATALPTGGSSPYSYAWDANTGNQVLQTATALCAGTYFVTITDTNGCTAIDTAIVDNVVGITTLTDDSKLSVYPNPNQGSFTVTLQDMPTGYYRFEIRNVLGQVVYQDQLQVQGNIVNASLNLEHLNMGTYTLSVSGATVQRTSKLVLQ